MDFFSSCKDKDEAKKVYRNLCKHFHPDKGGDPELMLELQKQYEKFEPKNEVNNFYNDLFNSQRFYGSPPLYEFNRLRRGNFDNPLHEEIRKLKYKIQELEIQKLKSTDFEKMTVFEFMKYKWSKKDEKQS